MRTKVRKKKFIIPRGVFSENSERNVIFEDHC